MDNIVEHANTANSPQIVKELKRKKKGRASHGYPENISGYSAIKNFAINILSILNGMQRTKKSFHLQN